MKTSPFLPIYDLSVSNPVSNKWRNPWWTIFVTELSWYIRPSENGGNKEREPASPVVTDICLWRCIWLIIVCTTRKGILSLIGYALHTKYSCPDIARATRKGVLGPIGHVQYRKHSQPTRNTESILGAREIQKDIIDPIGHAQYGRALTARGCSSPAREYQP